MPLLEEGRVCVKKLGRDAGNKAVITKVVDKNFVHIRSVSRPKDRKCNVKHLEFLGQKINLGNKQELDAFLEIKPRVQHTAAAGAQEGQVSACE